MPARIATKVRTKHEKLLTLGRAVGGTHNAIMSEVHTCYMTMHTGKTKTKLKKDMKKKHT